jgi:hypothetical protein
MQSDNEVLMFLGTWCLNLQRTAPYLDDRGSMFLRNAVI